MLWEIHPRHPPRAVSARATNSLFLSAALSSHSLPAGRELGAALVWGKEGILPPARAPPRSFGVRPSHNPLPRFHFRVYFVASAFRFLAFDWGGVRPSAWTLLAETARGKCKCLPRVSRRRDTPPTRARTRGLPFDTSALGKIRTSKSSVEVWQFIR